MEVLRRRPPPRLPADLLRDRWRDVLRRGGLRGTRYLPSGDDGDTRYSAIRAGPVRGPATGRRPARRRSTSLEWLEIVDPRCDREPEASKPRVARPTSSGTRARTRSDSRRWRRSSRRSSPGCSACRLGHHLDRPVHLLSGARFADGVPTQEPGRDLRLGVAISIVTLLEGLDPVGDRRQARRGSPPTAQWLERDLPRLKAESTRTAARRSRHPPRRRRSMTSTTSQSELDEMIDGT